MHAKAVGLATCPSLVRPGLRAERWPLSSPECEPESLILAFVWGLQGWVLFSGALPACLSGAVPEASGRHAPPSLAGLPPHLQALLAVSTGALADSPIQSLLRFQRTETKQNKLVSWPEQRAHR